MFLILCLLLHPVFFIITHFYHIILCSAVILLSLYHFFLFYVLFSAMFMTNLCSGTHRPPTDYVHIKYICVIYVRMYECAISAPFSTIYYNVFVLLFVKQNCLFIHERF